MGLTWEECGAYVPAMERNHNPTAHDEMMRMLDECARLGKENAALRSLLGEWYALFAPVRREGTEGARLLDRTAEAMASEFRYKTPNAEVSGAGTASAGLPGSAATDGGDDGDMG